MNFRQINEFSREFKKLAKKYRTLKQDLENFKKRVPEVDMLANKNFAVLHIIDEKIKIVKARFFCRQLKGKSLRIIFAYSKEQKFIEFIEIYYKGDKANEDRTRIKQYLKSLGL